MDQPWYEMRDAYQSALWDIDPYCQVAGICEDDTIMLDGAHGASIRWKSFFPVGWETGFSWKRWFAVKAMQNMTLCLVLMVLGFAIKVPAIGVIFLLLYIIIFLRSPMLIRTVYGGKFVGVQAALFGFEGYLNAPTVERAIFGGAFGRIGWSANGSPLSRSYVNEFNEREGMDPTSDPDVRIKVEQAKHAKPGEMRVSYLSCSRFEKPSDSLQLGFHPCGHLQHAAHPLRSCPATSLSLPLCQRRRHAKSSWLLV